MTDSTSSAAVWTGDDAVLVIVPMSARGALHDEEARLAQAMAPDRQREFSAGRIAARNALRLAGAPEVAVPMGDAGEPLWPANWVGSLSHTRTHAAALVAPLSRYRGVGVDLDDGRSLGDDAAADLMGVDEVRLVIAAGIAGDWDSAQRFVFSAKEAVFKCQYPLTRNSDLPFPAVQLAKSRTAATPTRLAVAWRTHLLGPTAPDVEIFPVFDHGLTLAVAVVLQ